MSTFFSNSERTVDAVNLNSEYKKRTKTYEELPKAMIIISTATGMASFIWFNFDVESITSFFFSNEKTSRMVANVAVPVFSFLAATAFTFYTANTKK